MTEDQIEQFAIERLKALGYAYAYGPVIAHDGEAPERANPELLVHNEGREHRAIQDNDL